MDQVCSVADPVPGSGICFSDHGSGPYFWELSDIFWVKNTPILCQLLIFHKFKENNKQFKKFNRGHVQRNNDTYVFPLLYFLFGPGFGKCPDPG